MTGPSIGDRESPDRVEDLLCGLRSTLPDQRGRRCEDDATLHLLMEHPEDGTPHMLLTCPGHYLTAVQAGRLVADHPVDWGCGQPDSRWDAEQNRCVPASGGDGW